MFPVTEKYPICGAGAKLVRHGFYSRYAVFRNRSSIKIFYSELLLPYGRSFRLHHSANAVVPL